jgi:hypothetical protein
VNLIIQIIYVSYCFVLDERAFCRTLLCGAELGFLTLYILLYNIIDIYTTTDYGPMLAVFLIDRMLMFIRNHFVQRNIAQKTFLESKFLL